MSALPCAEARELPADEAEDVLRSSGWGYLDADAKTVWPACCGLCEQGHKLCTTPEACQMAVKDEQRRSVESFGWLLVYAVGVLLAFGLLAIVTRFTS